MFVKVTKSGPRKYVQLVEAYRDDEGRPKQRTIASLGRLDQISGGLDAVIDGLAQIIKRPLMPLPEVPSVTYQTARSFGDIWVLQQLWEQLGLPQLERLFKQVRYRVEVEALIRVMVFHRLCCPGSKLGVLRWLQTSAFPALTMEQIEHQHLLRAMDALIDHQEAVQKLLVQCIRPWIDEELSVVFYDMTTVRAEGLSEQNQDIRRFGMAKEGLIARQVMIGLVQTAEGIPLYHEVFEGNTAEVKTLIPVLEKVLKLYPIKRVIAVADRGLLSLDNLQELQAITLPGGTPLEFILAVPGRRYGEFVDVLDTVHQEHCAAAKQPVMTETTWQDWRLVVAFDPKTAKEQGLTRDAKIQHLEALAVAWASHLNDQEQGDTPKRRGRPLSDGGVRARFYHEVKEAHLTRILRVDLHSPFFSYDIDDTALQHARLMDGKLLLVTNNRDLTSASVIERYKALADIERGFRVLKSAIEIGPMYHRLPRRIQAHAQICFMALVLYRIMRRRLTQTEYSPERALDIMETLQVHRITLNGYQHLTGLTNCSEEQRSIMEYLKVQRPLSTEGLALL